MSLQKSFAKSFLLPTLIAFALAGKAQTAVPEIHLKNSKTTEAQKDATQLKLQRVTFREPALCISEGNDLHLFQDFTGKGHSVIEQPLGNGRPMLQGIAADNKGNIYEVVTDPVFGPYVKNILTTNRGSFTGPLKGPVAIACDKQGRIYIVDQSLGQVIRIDDLGGKNLIAFGSVGRGIGQFRNPSGIAIGNDGKIYISDTDNDRIVRIDDMSGSGWTTYDGHKYGGLGLQIQPGTTEIAVDSKNRLYYLQRGGTALARVDDMEGSNMKYIPYALSKVDPSLFYRAIGIAVDRNDKIYISDAASGDITRFDDMDGNGRTLLNHTVEFFRYPGRIAVYYPVRDVIK